MQIRAEMLPDILPVFPLRGALLLPHSILPLRVFEPRYIALVDDAFTVPRMFVMVQPRDGDSGKLYKTGCAGQITHFEERDDGTYTVLLRGIARVTLKEPCSDMKPYLRYNLDWREYHGDLKESSFKGFALGQFCGLVERYFASIKYSVPIEKMRELGQEELINMVACVAPFSEAEKQALLEAEDLQERCKIVQILMEMGCLSSQSEEFGGV
ncbi:MAG: LON peptidase substrate-binding domain-containing protein [Pseudomonadota bacterium]